MKEVWTGYKDSTANEVPNMTNEEFNIWMASEWHDIIIHPFKLKILSGS